MYCKKIVSYREVLLYIYIYIYIYKVVERETGKRLDKQIASTFTMVMPNKI